MQVLDMSPNTNLFCGEPLSPLCFINSTKSTKIIHFWSNKPTKT